MDCRPCNELDSLVADYLAGGDARDKIISSLVPMVRAIARKYYNKDYEEAYSSGLYHLVISVIRFPEIAVDNNIRPYVWVRVKNGIHSDLYRTILPATEDIELVTYETDDSDFILSDILDSLSDRFRQVAIGLIQGYNQKEIAELVQCNERDTSSLIETVLVLLRREIDGRD